MQNLGLQGYVEVGSRLVCDEHLRLECDADCQENALRHATAELERVAVEHILGIGNAHLTEQFYGEGAGAPATEVRVLKDYFLDLLADGNDGVQRRTCILEYQGDLLTADVADLLGGHAQQLAAVVGDAALDDLAGEWHELKHGEGGYGFSGAALAYDAEYGVFFESERDAVDCLVDTVLAEEVGVEVFDFEKMGWHGTPSIRLELGYARASAAAGLRRE